MSLVINFLTGAPRPPAPAPVDPPAGNGDGRFGNLLDNLWEREAQSGGFLGDATAARDDTSPDTVATVADMFNQHGLLAQQVPVRMGVALHGASDALPPGEAGAATIAIDPAAGEAQAVLAAVGNGRAGARVAVPLTVGAKVAATLPPAPALAPVGAAPVPAPPAVPAPDIHRVPAEALRAASVPASAAVRMGPNAPVVPALLHASMMGSESGVPDDMGPAAPTRRDARDAGSAAGAQLSLHLAGEGATVVARLAEAGPTERLRLRDRIAALLARHGLRAHDIRLNGRPWATVTDQPSEER